MNRYRIAIVGLLMAGCAASATDLDFFIVGNSLSDGLGTREAPRDMLQLYVGSSAENTIPHLGTCLSAGASLALLWNGYGDYSALQTDAWDVLTLQPYPNGSSLYDAGGYTYDRGDIVNAKNFISLALTNSPNIQPYIYSHWPAIPDYMRHMQWTNEINPETGTYYTWEEAEVPRQAALEAFEAAGGWAAHWDALYEDPYSVDNCRTRDYFEQVVNILNTDRQTPGDPIYGLQHDVLMIPVGDVMYELQRRMQATPEQFPRAASSGGGFYTNIVQIHSDIPHLDPGVGRFIGAATWYATIYHKHPGSLDYTVYNDTNSASGQYYTDYEDPYYEEITPDCAAAICEAVWDVVSTHPYAGVLSADADNDTLPDWWETEHYGGPTNANPAVTAANGINTVEECYIAGLDPTDETAEFLISNLEPPVLQWPNVFGRIYNVYWTSNLLTGFGAPVATNLISGSYTDTLHPPQGFYKIDVQFQPQTEAAPEPEILASWNFDGTSLASASEATDYLNSGLGVTSASVDENGVLIPVSRNNAICYRNLDEALTLNEAIANSSYIDFVVGGSGFQATGILLRISGWGVSTPYKYTIRSSVDGYSTDVVSETVVQDSSTNPSPPTQHTFDTPLTGPVTLRLYVYDGGNYGPYLGIGTESTTGINDIEIQGIESP